MIAVQLLHGNTVARLTTPFVWAAELIDNGFSVSRALRTVSEDWKSLTDRIDALENQGRYHGEIEDNTATMLINTAGVYEQINAVLIPDPVNTDFTSSGSVITYMGTQTKVFYVFVLLSGRKLGPGGDDYSIKFYLNGTTPIAGKNEIDFSSNQNAAMLSLVTVLSLSTNDTVEAKVTSTTSVDDIDVINMTMTLLE